MHWSIQIYMYAYRYYWYIYMKYIYTISATKIGTVYAESSCKIQLRSSPFHLAWKSTNLEKGQLLVYKLRTTILPNLPTKLIFARHPVVPSEFKCIFSFYQRLKRDSYIDVRNLCSLHAYIEQFFYFYDHRFCLD